MIFELADLDLAAAEGVLGSVCLAVILGPTPPANATVGVLAAVLVCDGIALVAPIEFFSRECLRVSFASAGSLR